MSSMGIVVLKAIRKRGWRSAGFPGASRFSIPYLANTFALPNTHR